MSHTAPKTLSDYRKDIDSALEDSFLRRTLDTFAVAYRANREAVFKEVDERGLIKQIADAKDDACKHMEELYEQFRRVAEERGVHVHRAATAEDANRIIASIARENNVKRVIKSKSMTAEEIQLNPYLEKEGFIVDETDLGEWIIQLRHEGPSHMVMPAIHLSRYQVADDFTKETGVKQDAEDIQRLVKVARVQLRRKFINGDMGISGCNFAVAEMGAVSTVTNEGNARMVTTLPRVHVAIAGLDKLVPNLEVALTALQVLPRNATAQRLTAYATFMAGAGECGACEDNKKIMHVVFLDNGRTEIARDPLFSQIFRCVRCGACANVCPVFRLVGGHKMGYIYIGAIGLILTYFFHGKDKAKVLCQNCVGCESCKNVCAGGIDLPRLIREIRSRLTDEQGGGVEGTLMAAVMKNRKMFHSLLKFASYAQKPFTGGTQFQRHLPAMFLGKQNLEAFDAGKYDAIITLCASCASHLKHVYPHILEGKADAARVQLFSDKVTDYSSFVHDVLGLTEKDFNNSGEKVTYHASCHICRGLGVTKAPRDLIADAATYVPCAEEDVCCGFGGTYSMKFPEISGTLLAKKLKHIEETGASRVVMDCPGCVMQLRGGVEKQGMKVKVSHIAELVAENLKN